MTSRWRIGFDIGGTFSDFILLDTACNEIRLHKCLTTPDDPFIGALESLDQLMGSASVSLAAVGGIVGGATLVTNPLIEPLGAELGLVSSEGVPRQILEKK